MWMFNPSSDSLNNANLSFLLFFLTKLPVSFGLKDEHGSIAADWTRISSYWQTGEGLTHRSSHLLCLLSKKHWSVFFFIHHCTWAFQCFPVCPRPNIINEEVLRQCLWLQLIVSSFIDYGSFLRVWTVRQKGSRDEMRSATFSLRPLGTGFKGIKEASFGLMGFCKPSVFGVELLCI